MDGTEGAGFKPEPGENQDIHPELSPEEIEKLEPLKSAVAAGKIGGENDNSSKPFDTLPENKVESDHAWENLPIEMREEVLERAGKYDQDAQDAIFEASNILDRSKERQYDEKRSREIAGYFHGVKWVVKKNCLEETVYQQIIDEFPDSGFFLKDIVLHFGTGQQELTGIGFKDGMETQAQETIDKIKNDRVLGSLTNYIFESSVISGQKTSIKELSQLSKEGLVPFRSLLRLYRTMLEREKVLLEMISFDGQSSDSKTNVQLRARLQLTIDKMNSSRHNEPAFSDDELREFLRPQLERVLGKGKS